MENTTTIALSRLVAQQRSIDVTAANIANANTPGYRAERMVFSDWLLKEHGSDMPAGERTLAYTQDRATYRDTQAGPLTHTGNPLDLALGADGYFSVQTASGVRLTRAGHFELSPAGGIVDAAGDALLDPTGKPIQTAPADTTITVAADGTISSENGQIGKIAIVTPADARKMQAEGSRLLNADATTTAAVAVPKLVQGAIEGSNVEPITEMTRMMSDQREFEFVSQFVQAESDREKSAIDKIMQKTS